MKLINKIILSSVLFFLISCQNKEYGLNHFSSSIDTLIIKTKKQKGDGLFQLGAAVGLKFNDTSEKLPYSLKYPENLDDTKVLQLKTDFKEKKDFFVDILNGYKNGQKVFVVDENNNKDFNDDTIRPYEKILWNSSDKLVKCVFQISDGKKISQDSSWLRIGISNNNQIIGRSEHLIGEFSIGNENYEVGIIELRNAVSFTYGFDSEIALLSNKGKKKDSISNRDLLKLGELLNLNENFYRFESISNKGEFITLVKVKNFENKIGTQIGMIAPSFSIVSTKGDTINSSNLHNKVTVIANSCGCGGDIESTQAFYDIKNNFKNLNVLHIDSKIDTKLNGLHFDMENEFNKDFYNNYRMQYCSRICYIIGKDERIIDKFNITDWETILPKIIEK